MIYHLEKVHKERRKVWVDKWELYKKGKSVCPFNRDEICEETKTEKKETV